MSAYIRTPSCYGYSVLHPSVVSEQTLDYTLQECCRTSDWCFSSLYKYSSMKSTQVGFSLTLLLFFQSTIPIFGLVHVPRPLLPPTPTSSTGCIERLAFECFDEDGDGFIAIPEEVEPDYFPAPPVTHASDRDNDDRLNRDEFEELQRDPQYVSYVEGRTCPSLTANFCQ